ncbi:MAG: hypothetical protein EP349_03515 [Alphaproteobacteria bacterium]|nr:MAG: hypothetical protein EP349_03515 [Alphaproteobacteria bacterium]
MAANLTYHAKLAGYHIGKKATLGAGPVIGGIAAALLLGTGAIDFINNDLDPTGTDQQQQVLEQLQTQKASLLTQISEYQDLQRQSHATETDETTLQAAQTSLQESGMRFFADLLTSGSMQHGLDIGEADAKTLLEELKSDAGDFDWGRHVNSAIPDMIAYGIDYAENLDEARADHRHEGTEALAQRFSIASEITADARQANEMDFLGYFIAIMLSALAGLGAGAALDEGGKKMRYASKPTKPPAQPKH